MSDLLFYAISCLILNICKHFLTLFKLICNAVFCSSPALRSIISLVQGFCFCDNVFQWCGICITCRFCNILSCCLEFYNVILVSKGMNSKDPVTSSICSFRKHLPDSVRPSWIPIILCIQLSAANFVP